jgi:hypothetical protein
VVVALRLHLLLLHLLLLLLLLLLLQVWISAEEASAIAKHLNLPLRRFLALHARSYSKKVGWFMLRSNMESQVTWQRAVQPHAPYTLLLALLPGPCLGSAIAMPAQ